MNRSGFYVGEGSWLGDELGFFFLIWIVRKKEHEGIWGEFGSGTRDNKNYVLLTIPRIHQNVNIKISYLL